MPPTGLPPSTRTFAIGGGEDGALAVVPTVLGTELCLSELSLGLRMMNATTATTATDTSSAIRPAVLTSIPPLVGTPSCVRPTQAEVHAHGGRWAGAGRLGKPARRAATGGEQPQAAATAAGPQRVCRA